MRDGGPTDEDRSALVFEAETAARFFLHQVLIKMGWGTYLPPAFDRRLVVAFDPTVVILGRLPQNIDRVAAMRELRETYHRPLLLVTAFEDDSCWIEERDLADACVARPLNPSALADALESISRTVAAA